MHLIESQHRYKAAISPVTGPLQVTGLEQHQIILYNCSKCSEVSCILCNLCF